MQASEVECPAMCVGGTVVYNEEVSCPEMAVAARLKTDGLGGEEGAWM